MRTSERVFQKTRKKFKKQPFGGCRMSKLHFDEIKSMISKVQEIRNATHSFRSEKFLLHCVQHVS
jgi:hypothetical protein